MAPATIGIEALFQDSQFQQGLARYMAGLSRAESATQRTAGVMTSLGHTISTALGTAIGVLTAQAIPKLMSVITSPLDALKAWGGGVHELGENFGFSDETAAGFAAALQHVGMTVDEGASGMGYFIRQLQTTKEQFAAAGETYASATAEISSAHADAIRKINADWVTAQAEAADSIATIWQDLAEKRADIEQNESEQIASINESLQERLADIADQRARLEADTARSLVKLADDTKDRLRNARSARDRRQIRKDAAEQKAEILRQAAERKAELDKQEAREKAHAAKQIALAEKVAQKQIEAAEKAAAKQTEAIEKALAKQQKAMQEQIAEQEKQYAKQMAAAKKSLSDVTTKSPLSKALAQLGLTMADVTDDAGDFTEQGLAKIMDAFAKLPEGVKSSAIAMQLFGKSGRDWMEFLRLGSKGLDEWKKKALALGLGVQTDDVKRLNRAMRDLDVSMLGLKITIGNALLPYVTQLAEGFNSILSNDIVPKVQQYVKRISDAFKTGGLEGAGKEFWKILTEPSGVFDQLSAFVARIRDWFTTGDGSKILAGAGSALSSVISAFNTWAGGKEGQSAITTVTKTIGDAVMAGIQLVLSAAEKVSAVMLALTDSLLKWVESPRGQAAIEKITQAIARIVFDSLGKLLSDNGKGRLMIQSLGDNLYNAAQNLAATIARIGGSIAGSLVGGIVSNFVDPATTTRIRDAINNAVTAAINLLITPGGPLGLLGSQLARAITSAFSPTTTTPDRPLPFGTGEKYANGGWVGRTGPALVHAGEYVLNRQQAMAWAPMLTRPNVTSNSFTFSHTWNGAPASFDRRDVERIAEDAAYRGLSRVLPGR